MATYWENSCSFGLRYVSWYKYLIVSLVFSHLAFWSGNLFLIAPFPYLCLLVPLPTCTFFPLIIAYLNFSFVIHIPISSRFCSFGSKGQNTDVTHASFDYIWLINARQIVYYKKKTNPVYKKHVMTSKYT